MWISHKQWFHLMNFNLNPAFSLLLLYDFPTYDSTSYFGLDCDNFYISIAFYNFGGYFEKKLIFYHFECMLQAIFNGSDLAIF